MPLPEPAPGEFGIIQRYFADTAFPSTVYSLNHEALRASELITLGIGDDAAALHIPEHQELLFSIDTQNVGVHFPVDAHPAWIAQRAFRCAVSDLAAMGATPLCFTLALTLPEANAEWLEGFSRGLKQAAREFSCSLVGGDTTRGPLSITLQVHGLANKGTALKRSGAQPDDIIFVSGTLGGGAAYVKLMQEQRLGDKTLSHAIELFEQAYYFPASRIPLGRALPGRAHSAIDISDGLLADLGHICERSGVCAGLDLAKLPIMPELTTTFGEQEACRLALTGGDDYELCFTAPERTVRKLLSASEDMEIAITAIGKIGTHTGDIRISARDRITCYDENGSPLDGSVFTNSGYSHF
jgi:thiamine-monophosphate kinase